MFRYIKIFYLLIKMNASVMLSSRVNFFNSTFISFGWGAISIGSMLIMTTKTRSIYGWSGNQLLLLTGIYSIINGLHQIFFTRSFERFSRIIGHAELDGYLLKPIDTQFLLSFSTINLTNFIRTSMGIIFVWYVLGIMRVVPDIMQVGIFLLFILLSLCILYSMWFLVMTLVIWFNNLTNLVDFLYILNNFGRYPPETLTKGGFIALLLLVPLTYATAIPAKEMLQTLHIPEILIFLVFSIGLLLVARVFFTFSLKSYTSASS